MNTKEAIEVLNNHRKYTKYTLIDGELDGIIELLKRGEKYEKIFKEFRSHWFYHGKIKDDYKSNRSIVTVCEIMENLRQKYFPKGGK